MTIQYINRRGDTYFLHRGQTKAGKPKWFFSTKQAGELASSVPEGFEIYENYNAQVFLRKIVPRLVTEEEVATVEKGIRTLAKLNYFVTEVKEGSIIVYLSNGNTAFLENSIISRFGIRDRAALWREMQRFLTYSPMMRFNLVDQQRRRFAVDRWCFLGSIDDWFPLAASGELSKLVKKCVPHLGQESFFELM
jgi:hypothetical protein